MRELETKHTKGTWIIHPTSENYICTDLTDDFAICKAFCNDRPSALSSLRLMKTNFNF